MRMSNFAKRNFKEMFRDPLIYVFAIGFPVVMLCLFAIINNYSGQQVPMFELKSLIPGVMMFSFTFVMLLMVLLLTKDLSTAFLVRLFTSPMKNTDFVMGYVITGVVIGVLQQVVCILGGFVLSATMGQDYIAFGKILLLIVQMWPVLLFNIFLGIVFGTVLNEKAAPGVTSIIISGSGILGGAWMPLETMGGFRDFCCYLPFYPAVRLGRMITGAPGYEFDSLAVRDIAVVLAYTVLAVVLSIVAFSKKRKKDK